MRDTASILHVDMDSFYASVEVLLDPSLKGKPVIVGGTGNRGVVASCSYEARAYGIHSAMPSVRARRLCPHAVFLHGNFDNYTDYSRRIHEVFNEFTPLVEGISLDEAFLDVAGARRLFGDGESVGRQVRAAILDTTGLNSGVGVASCKLLAKLASKEAKPKADRAGTIPGRGVVVVPPGDELRFLHPLPVEALWGVGPATYKRLARFGVKTVGDLAALPVTTLTTALGAGLGQHLHDLAWARDDRPVEAVRGVKSIGHEETYADDKHTHAELEREVIRMADAVSARMRKAGVEGRTITIKVRYHDFNTITRSHTLPSATDTAPAIAAVAKDLLAGIDPGSGVRLFGVTASNLAETGARQLTMDDVIDDDGWHRATAAIDQIRDRFGDKAVGPATLLDDGEMKVKRQGDTQWGPKGRSDR
ncbi:MAG: DNA polymerase IV [Acidimicrobiales bacterium]